MIAASKDELQDVSWRYSVDHDALKARRKVVREQWLTLTLLKLSEKCQEGKSEEEKRKLTERRYVNHGG